MSEAELIESLCAEHNALRELCTAASMTTGPATLHTRDMRTTRSTHSPPRSVAIVGAGMTGLATAWFLQERDVAVTVIDRDGIAAGASWGNAGWLTPGLAAPLPDPAVLRYGIRAVLDPSSPVYLPLPIGPRLLQFLTKFACNSTAARWRRSMAALVPINNRALSAFDHLAEGGVNAHTQSANPFLAAFRAESERTHLVKELNHVRAAGLDVHFDLLNREEVHAMEPLLGDEVGAAIRLRDQRFINPGAFAAELAAAVERRGGTFQLGTEVAAVENTQNAAVTRTDTNDTEAFDAVVLANGAWLDRLAQPHGVRMPVQAGRGYSFSVPTHHLPSGPLYFPNQRVACTPLGDKLRIAGMMEFRSPDAPLDPRRITAIVNSVRPLLNVGDPADRVEDWVGSRPCTHDGLPLIGRTRSPRVYVTGGHGMWGITLGPATGELLADLITTGEAPSELAAFDPLR